MTTYQSACACADPECRQYGCKLYRPAPHFPQPPSYYPPAYPSIPGTVVFDTTKEIMELKRRVAELEKKLEEKNDRVG